MVRCKRHSAYYVPITILHDYSSNGFTSSSATVSRIAYAHLQRFKEFDDDDDDDGRRRVYVFILYFSFMSLMLGKFILVT